MRGKRCLSCTPDLQGFKAEAARLFAPLHINATHEAVFTLNSNTEPHRRSPAGTFSLASAAVVSKVFGLMPASVSPGRRSGSVMGLTHSPPAFYSEWRLHVFFFSTACVGFSMVIRFSSHGSTNIQQMREMMKIIAAENKLNCFAALSR